MAMNNNQRSFISHSPKTAFGGMFLPRGLHTEQADYFRRAGSTFQFQNADGMGLSPILRLLPLLALVIAVIVASSTLYFAANFHEQLAWNEVAALVTLAFLLMAMISGISWLLKDLSRAAIIDTKQQILWLGGGWLGRWQAISFGMVKAVKVERIAEDGDAEYPWGVFVVDLDGESNRICEELSPELARTAADELAKRLECTLEE